MAEKVFGRFGALPRPSSIKRYMRWLAANTRPYTGTLLFFLAVDVAGIALGMGGTLISKHVVDAAFLTVILPAALCLWSR